MPTVYLADSNGSDAPTLRNLRTMLPAIKGLIERICHDLPGAGVLNGTVMRAL